MFVNLVCCQIAKLNVCQIYNYYTVIFVVKINFVCKACKNFLNDQDTLIEQSILHITKMFCTKSLNENNCTE